MINILLQTTITNVQDDWNISRFSLLRDYLSSVLNSSGERAFSVTARNREASGKPDPVLSTLDKSDFDQLWLFAVDVGDGLTEADCVAVSNFRRKGGGLMVTRDHMDLGSSICTLAGVGAAHHFHSKNQDPDEARRMRDDPFTREISWPNYHSGSNGGYQEVAPIGEPHEVLKDPLSPTGLIRFLPAHPHEGSVSAPEDDDTARPILTGRSAATGAPFNIAVAFEASQDGGRAIAQSTFHHFADYNWNPAMGSPSFVSEKPINAIQEFPAALRSTQKYVENVAFWLANKTL